MNPIPDEIHLADYWAILRRRRWVVYLAVGACVAIALLASFLATPLYRATATLNIDRQSPDILTFRDVSRTDNAWTAYENFYETQYKIIASETVAAQASERLDILAHPLFETDDTPGLLSRLRSLIPRKGVVRELDPSEVATAFVLSGLEVTPVRNSQLVDVSWVSSDPELAARVANTVTEAYIQYTLRSTFSMSGQASDFLSEQVAQIKGEIEVLEKHLQDYGEKKGIVSIGESNNITLQSLSDVARSRNEAEAQLAQRQAAWDAIRVAPDDAIPQVSNSPLIQSLESEYAKYEALLSEKRKTFKEEWPEVVALRSRLEQVAERLEEETRQIAERTRLTAESDYLEARDRVRNFDALLVRRENDAQRLRRDAVEYNNLRVDVEKKRETLDQLLARLNEMALSTRLSDIDTTSSNVRVMTPASVPVAPFRPNIRLNLMLGLVAGLALGVGGAFVLDHLDNSIVTAADAEAASGLPTLAMVPRQGPAVSRIVRARRRQPASVTRAFDLVAALEPHSAASEAFRDLRTAILLSGTGRPPARLLVTSALPSEGKSATAANLAIVLAQLGRRVLLVDADLRKPRLHRIFSLDNEQGMTSYLSGIQSDVSKLIRPASVEGLDVLTSGPIPPNPSELLNSERFKELGQILVDHGYEHVVYDSAPTLAVADPVLVAGGVDAFMLVTRSGSTPRPSLRLAVERFEKAGLKPLGVVLNDAAYDVGNYGGYRYRTYAADDPGSTAAESTLPPTRAERA